METPDPILLESLGFEYRGIIAKGGYGTVFNVYSPQYRMNFALKRISSEKSHDSEIECMLQIRSPYTVTLYKYVRSGEYVYLILEYCPNSLDKIIIQNPRLPLEKQLKMAFGMVLALKGCHEFGISHGDIKPSNFLIDNYGRIKICDFGLSQKITEEPNTINLVGTLAYRSPEMIKMQPYDGFAADIWSLGVSLFILCTGTYPWNISSREKNVKIYYKRYFR